MGTAVDTCTGTDLHSGAMLHMQCAMSVVTKLQRQACECVCDRQYALHYCSTLCMLVHEWIKMLVSQPTNVFIVGAGHCGLLHHHQEMLRLTASCSGSNLARLEANRMYSTYCVTTDKHTLNVISREKQQTDGQGQAAVSKTLCIHI